MKEQLKSKHKKYYQNHKEQLKTKKQEYRQNHKEQLKAKKQEYRQEKKKIEQYITTEELINNNLPNINLEIFYNLNENTESSLILNLSDSN